MSWDEHLSMEEEFHSKREKKWSRKERKLAVENDRSKYKQSDQEQRKKNEKQIDYNQSSFTKGQVLGINPEGIFVSNQGSQWICQLKGSLKQEKNKLKNLVAVGDFVLFEPKDHNTGSICHILPRRSILSRADNLSRRKEQLIAVNIDQVIITCSVMMPAIKPHLIDRYIIAAIKGNMTPIVVINKVDLLKDPPLDVDPVMLEVEMHMYNEFLKAYAKLGVTTISVSTRTNEGMDLLKKVMQGKTSVFSGQSGVGKSSLINAVTGSSLKTGGVVTKTNKGSHTTSSTQLIAIEAGGFCIDTPGIKSFGVWDLKPEDLKQYYPEFTEFAKNCQFPNCAHLNEPQCGVKQAVDENHISELRFASYCALMANLYEEHRHR